MGRLGGLTAAGLGLTLALAAAAGCGRAREVEQRRELLTVPPQVEQVKAAVAREQLYDASGALQESDELVSGLRLPRGLQLTHTLERRWVYDTTVPLEALRKYFGPRLITGSVTPGGGAVTYTHAQAKDSQGEIFFDVVIGAKRGQPGHHFVDVRQYAPVPTQWPSDDEVRRQLAEAAKRGE